MKDFAGKGVVVTGGASGIGLALAKAFGSRGARVLIADIEESALEEAIAGLKTANIDAQGVNCDVSSREAVFAAAETAAGEIGKVHIVCNNAGVGGGGGPVESISANAWEWTLGVNLMSVVYGIQAFLPHMVDHGERGHIVVPIAHQLRAGQLRGVDQ